MGLSNPIEDDSVVFFDRGLWISTVEGDEAVQELTFLNQRAKSKLSASLVASGPAGTYA